MKTINIDIKILEQMLTLSSDDMHELIETVGMATCLNEALNHSPERKIVIAIAMLRHVYTILEQCDCRVKISIDNDAWTEQVSYTTGQNQQED